MARLRHLRRVYGSLTPSIDRLIATSLHETVDELIDAAVARWRTDNWRRYDNHESNCTVQLYRWSLDARRSLPELRVVKPQLEWVHPTPEMLSGMASATRLPRPDLRLAIGDNGLTLECKRLSPKQPLPALYVREGMKRFTNSKYAATESSGRLAAYVPAAPAEPTPSVHEVNEVIRRDPELGASQVLVKSAMAPRAVSAVYDSVHARKAAPEIRLRHYMIVLPPL